MADDVLSAFEVQEILKSQKPQSRPMPKNDDVLSKEETADLLRKQNPLEFSDKPKGLLDTAADYAKGAAMDALEVVRPVGEFVDSYTGAPTRSAIGELMTSKSPLKAAGAFVDQIGNDPARAPTGQQLARRAGVSDTALSDVAPSLYSDSGDETFKFKRGGLLDPTASGAVGLGVDILADPTNVVGFGAMAKGAVKGAKLAGEGALKAAELGARGVGKAVDILSATNRGTRVAEGLIGGTKDVADTISKTLDVSRNFKPLTTAPERLKTLEKYGIKADELPSGAIYGQRSVPAKLEKTLSEGLDASEYTEKWEKAREKLDLATQGSIQNASKAAPMLPTDAGDHIRSALTNSQKKLFDDTILTYQSSQKLVPNNALSESAMNSIQTKLNGLEKWAKGEMLRGTPAQRSAARSMLTTIQGARNAVGSGNYKQTVEVMSNIGRAAFGNDPKLLSRAAPDAAKLKDLYHTMSDGVVSTLKENVSPDMAAQLVKDNERMTDFFKTKSALGPVLDAEKDAARAFSASVATPERVKALKKLITPEDFNSVRASYLQDLVSVGNDGVNYGTTLKNLKDPKNAGVLREMFSHDELKDIKEILKTGIDIGGDRLGPSTVGMNVLSSLNPKNLAARVGGKKVFEKYHGETIKGLLGRSAGAAKSGVGVQDAIKGSGAKLLGGASFDENAVKKALMRSGGRSRPELLIKGAQSVAPQGYDDRQ